MIKNKKINSIVTELFIRGRKINIFLAFMTQSYFRFPKDVRLSCFFIVKIRNKREIYIVLKHSSDINTNDYIKIYKKYTA